MGGLFQKTTSLSLRMEDDEDAKERARINRIAVFICGVIDLEDIRYQRVLFIFNQSIQKNKFQYICDTLGRFNLNYFRFNSYSSIK